MARPRGPAVTQRNKLLSCCWAVNGYGPVTGLWRLVTCRPHLRWFQKRMGKVSHGRREKMSQAHSRASMPLCNAANCFIAAGLVVIALSQGCVNR
jgi:hypothetical protein